MQHDYSAIITSPLARLGLVVSGSGGLQALDYLPDDTTLIPPVTDLTKNISEQIRRYFESPGWKFDVPLALNGTPFQMRVWRSLSELDYGKTQTYSELATQLGTGARAIGNACRRNPVPIIIPCHRVVSASGLGGYSGATGGKKLSLKIQLIQFEARKAVTC